MPRVAYGSSNNDETAGSITTTGNMSKTSPLGVPSEAQAKHWAKNYRTELAASSSTVLSTFLAFPLESIKTRIQGDSPNFRACVRDIWRVEGLRGFWRGVVAPLGSVTLVRTFSFSVYQKAKYKTSAFIGRVTGGDEPLSVVNKPGTIPNLATMTCFGVAGATAGALSTLIATPFELIKNGMVLAKQIANTGNVDYHPVRSSYVGKGTFGTAQQIVKNCGPLGLYAGFRLQLIRETIGTGLYFMSYESGKQLLVKYQGVSNPTSPLAVALAGGFCGMFSLALTYPLDRAKTAFQKERLELGKKPSKAPPIHYFARASYQGLGVAASRSAVTNAILFSSFEYVKKRINNLDDPTSAEKKERDRERPFQG